LDAVTAEVELLRRRQRAEFLKVGAIADLIEDGIEEGKSVAVFLCFRDSLFALEQLLKERSIAAVKIIGGQSDTHREAAIRAFQNNECFAMLTMAQCGGISLNLHDILGRSRLALLSPDWNGVVVKQCLGRIHRAGGLSKSVQRLVLCAQTVEQNVYQSVMRKMGNMKGINEGAVAEAVESGFYEAVRGG
jgi:SNF2 family DNA or RNA helicase